IKDVQKLLDMNISYRSKLILSLKVVFSLILISVFRLAVSNTLIAQPLPFKKESSFKAGEVLKYKLKYGFILAAEASLTVTDSDVQFSSPHAFRLQARGKTSNAFSVLFPVDNRYTSYIDSKTFLPYFYTENISEGKYRRTDVVRFDH